MYALHVVNRLRTRDAGKDTFDALTILSQRREPPALFEVETHALLDTAHQPICPARGRH